MTRLAGTSLPVNSSSAPPAPAHLSERAQRLWSDVVPRRANSPECQAVVLVALEALTRADAARALVEREGMVLSGGKMSHAHPGLRVEKDALATFTKCWTALGLTRPTAYTIVSPGPLSGAA